MRCVAPPRRPTAGFTAIELLVALTILAILAALAYPGFAAQVRQARRSEAIAALQAWAQAQGRHRSAHPQFAASPGELFPEGAAPLTASGRYLLSIAAADDAGYLLLASAQGSQLQDTPCLHLGLQHEAGTTTLRSGMTVALDNDAATTQRCWRQ
jgi:type IV pilus assembly protein PilE